MIAGVTRCLGVDVSDVDSGSIVCSIHTNAADFYPEYTYSSPGVTQYIKCQPTSMSGEGYRTAMKQNDLLI